METICLSTFCARSVLADCFSIVSAQLVRADCISLRQPALSVSTAILLLEQAACQQQRSKIDCPIRRDSDDEEKSETSTACDLCLWVMCGHRQECLECHHAQAPSRWTQGQVRVYGSGFRVGPQRCQGNFLTILLVHTAFITDTHVYNMFTTWAVCGLARKHTRVYAGVYASIVYASCSIHLRECFLARRVKRRASSHARA